MSQFTKIAIMNTFVELLNEQPFDKITVTDIVDRCGVNRNTFYYYYQDIFALLDELFQIEREKIMEDTNSYNSWVEGFRQATKFAIDNKRAIYHIYNSLNREKLENYLHDVVRKNMSKFIDEQAKDLDVSETDKAVICDFYTFALVGSMFKWLGEGMKGDPDDYILTASRLLDGNIRYSLNKCSGKHLDNK